MSISVYSVLLQCSRYSKYPIIRHSQIREYTEVVSARNYGLDRKLLYDRTVHGCNAEIDLFYSTVEKCPGFAADASMAALGLKLVARYTVEYRMST